jgi:peptide/nickel transport system permease protein
MARDNLARGSWTAEVAEAPAADRLEQLAEQRREALGNRFWRRLRSERKAYLGLFFVAFLGIVALLGPWLAPYDPDAIDFGQLQSPTFDHPMGTDSFGRDLFSRVIIGTRVSFIVGICAALLSMVAGVTIGVLAGYYRGMIDTIIMRFIDLLWAFPVIILTTGIVAVYGAGLKNVIFAIAVANLIAFSRIVRGEVLSLREDDFTIAARAIGVRDGRIMVRHLLPNVAAPIIVQLTLTVGFGILAETGLTFLGLGVDPATPTWGQALNESRNFIRQAWWLAVFPGLAISFTVLSLNLFGDGLRDALDVKSISDV